MVVYGDAARREAREAIESLGAHNPGLPVVAVGEPVKGARHIPFRQMDPGGRWAKVNLDALSPWGQTLYLDADCRVRGDIMRGFRILDDGYDLAIALSARQGGDVLGNCGAADREQTFAEIGCREIVGLQAGVFWWRRGEAMRALFAAWRREWRIFGEMDQAALVRAMARVPVRLWLLGLPWNSAGGEIVDHRFGRARAA